MNASQFHFNDVSTVAVAIEGWRVLPEHAGGHEMHARSNAVVQAATVLSYQYTELLAAYEARTAELVAAESELLHVSAYLAEEESPGELTMHRELALQVRFYHDRAHRNPLRFCQHEMCRGADNLIEGSR